MPPATVLETELDRVVYGLLCRGFEHMSPRVSGGGLGYVLPERMQPCFTFASTIRGGIWRTTFIVHPCGIWDDEDDEPEAEDDYADIGGACLHFENGRLEDKAFCQLNNMLWTHQGHPGTAPCLELDDLRDYASDVDELIDSLRSVMLNMLS